MTVCDICMSDKNLTAVQIGETEFGGPFGLFLYMEKATRCALNAQRK